MTAGFLYPLHDVLHRTVALLVVLLPIGCISNEFVEEPIEANEPSCGEWNTYAFFGPASVPDVMRCLEAGAGPNARGQLDATPLHMTNDATVATVLIEAGANPHARDWHGFTPLHNAENAAMVVALLDAGADLHARDNGGHTPFLLAASRGLHRVLGPLVNAGADVNEPSDYGSTGLHLALLSKHAMAVKTLIELGADANAQDAKGDAPLHSALWFGPIHGPGNAIDDELVAMLLAAGASVDAKNDDGETPLHLAAFSSTPDAVSVLLQAGADASAEDHWGATPLNVAVRLLGYAAEELGGEASAAENDYWQDRIRDLEEIVSLLRAVADENSHSSSEVP